jgi:hypothetical protein
MVVTNGNDTLVNAVPLNASLPIEVIKGQVKEVKAAS